MGWAEAARERERSEIVGAEGVPQLSEGGSALRLDSAWCPGPSRF